MIRPILASVVLIALFASSVFASETESGTGKGKRLTNEANGMCWTGQLRCSNETNPNF